jgi:Ca-activated chloride channel homolog
MNKVVTYLLILIISGTGIYSQNKPSESEPVTITRLLFVLDASRSMTGKWQGESKYSIARTIMSQILDSIKNIDNVQVALRVYGHTKNFPPQNCNDTRLEVPFEENNTDKIKFRLKQLSPKGTSPIASSLLKTRDDFTPCKNCRNIVILITDGIEECGGDICEVSAALQKEGIFLKPFIIGIGHDTHKAYDCAGQYFNAANKEQFSKALKIIITKVLSKTSLQVNLLDQYNRPTVSNVNMTFTNKNSDEIEYNLVHTLNSKGFPDTLNPDHLINYEIVINTIPPRILDSVTLVEGKHTTVSTYCPQGSLLVKLMGHSKSDFKPAIVVYEKNNQELINTQYLTESINYIAGEYDLKVLTLPPIFLKAIDIEPDNNTKIEIENPGILAIQKSIKGYGSIYLLEGKKQKWVINIGSNSAQTESLYLQPGKYRFVFRSKYSMQSATTVEREFIIKSEKTTRIKL